MKAANYTESSAAYGPEQRPDGSLMYRYAILRRWAPGPLALWIGANPSHAGADNDDHTLGRIVHFTMQAAGIDGPLLGCGGVLLGNALAYISTDPVRLLTAPDPVGPDNDEHLKAMAAEAVAVVVCWGQIPDRRRISEVVSLLQRTGKTLLCLGVGSKGTPLHPALLANDTAIVPWRRTS